MNIKNLCQISLGNSEYTHNYFKSNIGEYPVYSSQTSNGGIIAKINKSDFKCKSGITWTKDGMYAGTVFKRVNDSFSMTTHCGFLEIKQEHQELMMLDYLFLWLSFNLKKEAVGEQNKRVTEQIIRAIDIPLYGNLVAQLEYIKKYSLVYELINKTKFMVKDIENVTTTNLEAKCQFKESSYLLNNIIKIGKTNKGFFTQKFVNDNKGQIPVYGASEGNLPSYGYVQDNLNSVKYFENCFTWNIDGSIAVFYRSGKFSLSEKVIPFYLNEEYAKKILPEYLVIKISEIAKEQGFSRNNKFGGEKLLALEVTMLDLDEHSLAEQQIIVDKHKEVDSLKMKIIRELESII